MRRRAVVTILMLIIAVIVTLPARAQQKPFTQDQVQALVRSGLGDESGAKLIGERGIDFAATEDFLQSLKTAGANEPFLEALRAAKRAQPPSEGAKKLLNPKSAKVTEPEKVDPALQARQAEVRQHVAVQVQFIQAKRYADAEAEIARQFAWIPKTRNCTLASAGRSMARAMWMARLRSTARHCASTPTTNWRITILAGRFGANAIGTVQLRNIVRRCG